MNTEKWIDRGLAITGILVSAIAGFDLLGVFDKFSSSAYIKYFNFFLGLVVLAIIVIKKRSLKTSFLKLRPDEVLDHITNQVNKSFNRAVLYNPNQLSNVSMLIQFLNTKGFEISIVGEAKNLLNVMGQLNPENLKKLKNPFHVMSFGQEESIVILYSDKTSKINITYSDSDSAFSLLVEDEEFTKDINRIFANQRNLHKRSIRLEDISKPKNFLTIISDEKERYLRNFKNLRSGYISFYGTEVQNIQSGWVESGNFKNIRTLDLTTNPGILMIRKRYIAANRDFISKGGTIKRVYLIERKNLDNKDFRNDLRNAIDVQKSLKVNIGLQFRDDLSVEQKQDFILYDNFASLVEEKQANSDYSFGKSTAYFSIDKIKRYEQIFEDVWNGTKMELSAKLNLERIYTKLND